jgi:general L-amino acid transport system substrate-binding protein
MQAIMPRAARFLCVLATLLTAALPTAPVQAGALLDAIKSRGALRCGVSEGIPGFSIERAGRWTGLDADYCRALAAALLGDADAVQFRPLGVSERFEALRDGRVDVLSRNSTWTLAREAQFDIAFVGILFFDGQGFLARRERGPRYALELGGSRVCVKPDTTSARNLVNYFATNAMAFTPVPVDGFDAMQRAFETGECDAVTSDQSQLHALRSRLADPSTARVLPEFISKEPLAPAVPASDPHWLLFARLVLAVLVNAEEIGIDSGNVAKIASVARSVEVRGLLDLDGRFVAHLGLQPGWAQRMLQSVGNYGEMFERNLGASGTLQLERGQNAPWNRGGLLYAPRID